MSDRIFPEVSIPYGDKSTKAMQITCACCGAVAYFPHQTGVNRKPPVAATQHFQNKGWVVGSSPRKDFCPIHAAPAKRKGQKAMVDTVATIADTLGAAANAARMRPAASTNNPVSVPFVQDAFIAAL